MHLHFFCGHICCIRSARVSGRLLVLLALSDATQAQSEKGVLKGGKRGELTMV
jgi:glycerol-3-phosphate cytidylyltransferase-like family protein